MRSLEAIRYLAFAGAITTLVSCASQNIGADAAKPISPSPSAPAVFSDGLHWFRDSAEQQAIYLETYRDAAQAARSLSYGLMPQSWGVILDVDETVLNNSEYMKRLATTGQKFDPRTWDAWVQARSATALPGAKLFIDSILDQLHGQIVLVTNRTQAQCDATEDNLRRTNLRYSRILCDRSGDGDKNPRFHSIVNGESGAAAPLNVLIWIGDNIRDFPDLDQKSPGDLAQFGTRYFALPNPMYGSWQQVPGH
jgi:5'-nucleotidase (lipoprotein e(P4) family)